MALLVKRYLSNAAPSVVWLPLNWAADERRREGTLLVEARHHLLGPIFSGPFFWREGQREREVGKKKGRERSREREREREGGRERERKREREEERERRRERHREREARKRESDTDA